MATATAPRRTKKGAPKAPGTITLPAKCKLSKACEPTGVRPIIQHAYLRSRADGYWLCATDSYIAAAIKVEAEGALEEGFVPVGALRLMERGQHAEQISTTAWRVRTNDGLLTYDISNRIAGSVKYPNFDDLGVFGLEDEAKPITQVGVNPKLLERLGAALGATYGLRFEFYGELRPIRAVPLSHDNRFGLQMPIRLRD